MKKLYGIQLEPIDFGWTMNRTVEEMLTELKTLDRDKYFNEKMDYEKFWQLWEQTKIFAHNQLGWEVEFREEPEVAFVPVLGNSIDINFEPIFIFKQDNNGLSFVVSPVDISCFFPNKTIVESL